MTFKDGKAFLADLPALLLQTAQNTKRIRLGITAVFLDVRAAGGFLFRRALQQV